MEAKTATDKSIVDQRFNLSSEKNMINKIS